MPPRTQARHPARPAPPVAAIISAVSTFGASAGNAVAAGPQDARTRPGNTWLLSAHPIQAGAVT